MSETSAEEVAIDQAPRRGPARVRICNTCGRSWRDGFALEMYRQRHGHDPAPKCPACDGRLGAWTAGRIAPLPIRIFMFARSSLQHQIDRVRRRLFL